jgi:hypothetical protein
LDPSRQTTRFAPIVTPLIQALLKEENDQLLAFDKGVVEKWADLVIKQRREMEGLGIPYFGVEDHKDPEKAKHRQKILELLEDLIPGQDEK